MMLTGPIYYADLLLQAGDHIDRLGYSLIALDKIAEGNLSIPFDELDRLNEAMQWRTELYWAFDVYKSLAFGTEH